MLKSLSVWCAVLSVWISPVLGTNVLGHAGLSYTEAGGSLPDKVAPFAYVAAFAGLAGALASLAASCVRVPRDLLLAGMLLGVSALSSLMLHGRDSVAIVFLNNIFPALACAWLLHRPSPIQQRVFRLGLITVLTINATFVLWESAAGEHIVPFSTDLLEERTDFRPLGLYDHPLSGAVYTALGLILAIATRGALGWVASAVLALALAAFGARLALAAIVLTVIGWFGRSLLLPTSGRGLARGAALRAAGLLGTAAALGLFAWQAGFFDRVLQLGVWDASAQARLTPFGWLDSLTWTEFFFGMDRAELFRVAAARSLTVGGFVIENFWLFMMLQLGVVAFLPFVAGFGVFMQLLWRNSAGAGRVVLALFVGLIAGFNSLGAKSGLLVFLVGVLAALPAATAGARRPLRAAVSWQVAS